MDTIRCFNPFQQMVVDATNGSVNPCGYWRHDRACGNVHHSSLLDIWNSKIYQRTRAGLLSGDMVDSCHDCYAIKQGLRLQLQYDEAAEGETPPYSAYAANLRSLKEDLAEGRKTLRAKPLLLSMTFTHKCNIRCRHCCQEASRDLPLSREDIYSETMELASSLSYLIIGGGEPFADRYWQRFFADWREKVNPYLGLAVTTNATIITNDILKQLDRFRHVTLNVSFDGGTPEVYENVRIGADFNKVMSNVDKMADLARTKGHTSTCGMSMSVMKSNILDLPNFLKLSRAHSLLSGLSPVVSMPVHEALTIFNDARQETQGWRSMFAEARGMLTDDFLRPSYLNNGVSPEVKGLRDSYLPVLEMIYNSIPWVTIDLPMVEASGQIPCQLLEIASNLITAKRSGPYRKKPVLVLFPESEGYAVCRYYTDIDDKGVFRITVPPGVYRLGLINSMDMPERNIPWDLRVDDAGKVYFHKNNKQIIKAILKRWAKNLLPDSCLNLLYYRGRDIYKAIVKL